MAKSIAHTHRPCFSRIRSYFIIFRTLAMATAARMLCTRPHIQFAYLRATTTSNWPYGLRQQREPDCANPYILSNNPNGHILRPQFYSPSACVVFVRRKKKQQRAFTMLANCRNWEFMFVCVQLVKWYCDEWRVEKTFRIRTCSHKFRDENSSEWRTCGELIVRRSMSTQEFKKRVETNALFDVF